MTPFEIAKPEIFLLIALCLVLLLDLFFRKESQVLTYLTAQLALLSTTLLTYGTSFSKGERMVGLDRMYMLDDFAGMLKIAVLLMTSMFFIYARKYLRDHDSWRGEFFVLSMTATLGAMIMVSGHHLLVLYLGLEMMSLSLYALIAMRRDDVKATEAAMKYFILGAVASGLLLYGMSLLYGLSGTLMLESLETYFVVQQQQDGILNNMPLMLALVFIVAGLAFKLGIVPFHMWLPDVYQGAPTPITLFLSGVPKLAVFALMLRLLAGSLETAASSWSQLWLLLGLASVILGNIVAIAQTSLKRMFAYSTIAHMGFIVMGVLTASHAGYSAALFYMLVYALMSMGGFAILILLGHKAYDAEMLDDIRGLNARHPWMAFVMMLILLAMMGFPFTAGFYAKLSIVQAVVGADLIGAAVVLVVMSVIGAFYYLRVIKLMYFDNPSADAQPVQAGFDFCLLLSVNGLLMLGLGILPGGLMSVCSAVLSASGL